MNIKLMHIFFIIVIPSLFSCISSNAGANVSVSVSNIDETI
jgi:hypothetical protein